MKNSYFIIYCTRLNRRLSPRSLLPPLALLAPLLSRPAPLLPSLASVLPPLVPLLPHLVIEGVTLEARDVEMEQDRTGTQPSWVSAQTAFVRIRGAKTSTPWVGVTSI